MRCLPRESTNKGGEVVIRLSHLGTAIAIGTLLIACGGDEKTASNTTSSAPADSATGVRGTVAKISGEVTKCLAMVKSERYVEAVEVCKGALAEGANVDVPLVDTEESANADS